MTSSISESNQGTSANEENYEEDSKAPDELKDFDFLYEEHPSTQGQDYLYDMDDYPNDDFYTSNTKSFKHNDSAHDTEREIDAENDGKDGNCDGNNEEENEKEIDLRPHFIHTQALDDLNENDSEDRKRDKKIMRKKRHKPLVENDGNSSDTSNQSKNSIRRPSTISYVRIVIKIFVAFLAYFKWGTALQNLVTRAY